MELQKKGRFEEIDACRHGYKRISAFWDDVFRSHACPWLSSFFPFLLASYHLSCLVISYVYTFTAVTPTLRARFLSIWFWRYRDDCQLAVEDFNHRDVGLELVILDTRPFTRCTDL
jgi:hypothetical protein